MKDIIYKTVFIIVTVVLNSCVKLDTVPLASDTDVTYWSQPNAAEETVNSCYQRLGNVANLLYNEGTTDNAYVRSSDGRTQAIGNGSYSTADSYVSSIWQDRYYGIKMCNRLTDNIDLVPDLTDELRNRYLAEAKVIRALHYHELIVRFGDVPYFTNVISITESESLERTPRSQVVSNILDELNDIIDNHYLPDSYDAADLGRINHWVALALKARILMSEGRYDEVKPITSDIIAHSGYKLHSVFHQVFEPDYEDNNEIMLDMRYAVNLRENSGNYQFLPPSLAGVANIVPTQELVNSYIMLNGKAIDETGSGYDENDPWNNRDPRLEQTICYNGGEYTLADGTEHSVATHPDSTTSIDRFQPGTSVITTTSGYYFKKFYDNQYITAQKSGLNYPIFRYADVLLMHAEACAETGALTSTEWDKTIKELRKRAGFTDASAIDFPSDKDEDGLIAIVRNERRCELAFEGLRLKDIFRWRTAEDVLNGNIHGMYVGGTTGTDNGYYIIETRNFNPEKHYLWPIPQSERDINHNLQQNPNW